MKRSLKTQRLVGFSQFGPAALPRQEVPRMAWEKIASLVLLVALAAVPAGAADWLQYQVDAHNSGVTQDAGPTADLTAKWTANIYDGPAALGLRFPTGATPALYAGTLYAYALGDATYDPQTFAGSAPAELVALNAADGAVRWHTPLADEGGWDSRNGVAVDPATDDVYVASWRKLYRLRGADGAIVWQHTLSGTGTANVVVNSAPTLADGKAFWLTAGGGHIVGIDRNAGAGGAEVPAAVDVALPTDIGASCFGTPAAFETGGTAYLAASYGHAYGLPMGGGLRVVRTADGSTLWEMSQDDLPAEATADERAAYSLPGSVTYHDGVVYAVSYDDQFGHAFNATLWARDAVTGAVLWHSEDPLPLDGTYDNAANSHQAPVVAEGKVFLSGGSAAWGEAGTKVQAYDAATGERLWSFGQVGGEAIGGMADALVYADGLLYVGREAGDRLFVLNPEDGSLVASYAGAGSSPVVADGVVYTVDADGHMVALVPEPVTAALLLAGAVGLLARRRRS